MTITVPLAPKLGKMILGDANMMYGLNKNQTKLLLEKTILEKENLKMEIEILKSQISPNFLFNTLNGIYRLSRNENPEISPNIVGLSKLLRYMVYNTNEERIFLAKEIEFLKDFFNLVNLRFGKKVKLDIHLDDITEPLKIMPLILFPLVENAIKLGPERSLDNAWVNVTLLINNGTLTFLVANGVNQYLKDFINEGTGLQSLRRRLDLKYQDKYVLEISKKTSSYTVFLEIEL